MNKPMTANKLGTVAQWPLYGCTSCYEKCVYPADDLRVYEGECWCVICWDERPWESPDRPYWSDLEPYTPADQQPEPDQYPPCDYCGVIPDYEPWHGSGVFNGEDSPHIHACNDCRHKLPAPAVQGGPVGVIRESDEMGVAPYADIWPWLEPGTKLYAAPQPAPDVSALVEALEKIAELKQASTEGITDFGIANDLWMKFTKARNIAQAALAACRKQGGDEK